MAAGLREILRLAGSGVIVGPNGLAILLVDTEGGDTHVDIGVRGVLGLS